MNALIFLVFAGAVVEVDLEKAAAREPVLADLLADDPAGYFRLSGEGEQPIDFQCGDAFSVELELSRGDGLLFACEELALEVSQGYLKLSGERTPLRPGEFVHLSFEDGYVVLSASGGLFERDLADIVVRGRLRADAKQVRALALFDRKIAYSASAHRWAVKKGAGWPRPNALQTPLSLATQAEPALALSTRFSPSGRLLAAAGDDHAVRLYDTESGRLLRTLTGHFSNVEDMTFSADESWLVSADTSGELRVWDPARGTLATRLLLKGKRPPTKVIFESLNSFWVLSDVARRFGLKVREPRNLMIKEVSKFPIGEVSDGRLFASGTLATMSPRGVYCVYDKKTGKERACHGDGSGRLDFRRALKTSPTGDLLVVPEAKSARVLRLRRDGSVLRSELLPHEGLRHAAWSQERLATVDRRGINLYRRASAQLLLERTIPSRSVKGLWFHPREPWVLVQRALFGKERGTQAEGMDNVLDVHAIESGELLFSLPLFSRARLSMHPRTERLAATGKRLRVFELNRVPFVERKSPRARARHTRQMWTEGEDLYLLGSDQKLLVLDGELGELSARPLKTRAQPEVKRTRTSVSLIDDDGNVRDIDAARTRRSGHLTFDQKSERLAYAFTDRVDILRVRDLEVLASLPLDDELKGGEVTAMAFSLSGKRLALSARVAGPYGAPIHRVRAYDIEEKPRVLARFINPTYRATPLAWLPDDVHLVSTAGDLVRVNIIDGPTRGRPRAFQMSHPGGVRDIAVSSRHFFTLGINRAVRIWHDFAGAHTDLFMGEDLEDWALVTHDNFYAASGRSLLAAVRGLESFDLDQIAAVLNRPDIVAARLKLPERAQQFYQALVERRQRVLGASAPKKVTPPVARILGVKLKREGALELDLALRGRAPLEQTRVFVNGVFQSTSTLDKKRRIRTNARARLRPGMNVVEVDVSAGGVRSARARHELIYAPKVGSAPRIYFVAFGVSDYRDNALDLQYAAQDAVDLEIALKALAPRHELRALRFLDAQVTRDALKRARAHLANARPGDLALVFVAGHGLRDAGALRAYYYLGHRADPGRLKATAIPFDDIFGILESSPAQRRLMLLDTCESGEDLALLRGSQKTPSSVRQRAVRGFRKTKTERGFKRGPNLEALVLKTLREDRRHILQRLDRASGAVVIASSFGSEASLESARWKNGAFTEETLKALAGAADVDDDGVVALDELKQHLLRAVPALTDGAQHPSVRADNPHARIELRVR